MKRILFALLVLTGCGRAPGPEQTFERLKTAAKAKDWKVAYGLLDPERIESALVGLAVGATMMASKEDQRTDLAAIFEKHRFAPPKDEKGNIKDSLKGVPDKAGLFADLVGFTDRHSAENAGFTDKIANSTFQGLKVEGDRATAMAVSQDGKGKEKMTFVRRNGSWYISPE